jgi:hypothetical protein
MEQRGSVLLADNPLGGHVHEEVVPATSRLLLVGESLKFVAEVAWVMDSIIASDAPRMRSTMLGGSCGGLASSSSGSALPA